MKLETQLIQQQPVLADKRGFFAEPFTPIRNSTLGDYNAKHGIKKGLNAYLSGAEWKLYTELARLTDGYQRDWVQVSFTVMAELTGMGRKAVMTAANGLSGDNEATRLVECDTSRGVALWSIRHENMPAFMASRCQNDSMMYQNDSGETETEMSQNDSSVYQNDSMMYQNDSGEPETEVSQNDSSVYQNDSASVSKRLNDSTKMTPPSKKENNKKKKKKKEIKAFAPQNGAAPGGENPPPENLPELNPPKSKAKHLYPERHEPLMKIIANGCGLVVNDKFLKADIIANYVGQLRDANFTVDEALAMTGWFKAVKKRTPDPASYFSQLNAFREYNALISAADNQAMRQAYVEAWRLGKIGDRLTQWELCQAMQGLLEDYAATPEQLQQFPEWWSNEYSAPVPLFHGLAKHWPSFLRDITPPETETIDIQAEGDSEAEPQFFAPPAKVEISAEAALWAETQEVLQLQMTQAAYDSVIRGTMLIERQGDLFVIGVKNKMALDWLENRLANTVQRVLTSVVGQPLEIQFKLMEVHHGN